MGRQAAVTDVPGFPDLVAQLDPAMAVVTTVSGGERAGCLVGFHAQCSIAPNRYVVWLSKANHTYRVALHAEHLAVHFLGQGNLPVAAHFGTTSGDRVDKLAQCDWRAGPGEVPLLTACGDRFVGRKVALLDEGSDHVCVVLEPLEAASTGDLRPLRLSQVDHLEPGHDAQERPEPSETRATAGDRRAREHRGSAGTG
jgi:flavin reductase (DIM6/NTAB) family NADH-FMN oxidoreductase RutF